MNAPEGAESREGLSDEEFSKLMQSVSAMAPLLKGFMSIGAPVKQPDVGDAHTPRLCARREALLVSLKPYLSPARCEAVDYLIRLARVGDAIRALQ